MPYFNATSTAKLLSFATPLVLHHTQPPVTHTTLSPVTQTLYTTVYEKTLLAACETSQWMATYTLTETCTGKPIDYVTPTIPPGFVVTTVACHACKPHEVEITCPGAQPTGIGRPWVSITGNGVTATVTATPHGPPGQGFPVPHPTGPAVPKPVVGGGPGEKGGKPDSSCSGHGPCPGSGPESGPATKGSMPSPVGSCSGPGPCPGSPPPHHGGMPSPVGSCSGPGPCPHSGSVPSGSGPGSCSGSGSCSGPVPSHTGGMPGSVGSCSGSGPCPGSGSGSGSGSSGCSSGSCAPSGPHGVGRNGTSIPPAVVTAGAPAPRNAVALFSGLAFVAGQFLLL